MDNNNTDTSTHDIVSANFRSSLGADLQLMKLSHSKRNNSLQTSVDQSSRASSDDIMEERLSKFLKTISRQTVSTGTIPGVSHGPTGAGGMHLKAEGPSIFAHLPDVVLNMDHRRLMPNQTSTQGVVMFLDISGFTALCETYSNAGKTETGIDQLTKTLNSYIGALVAEILSFDGDILKFAGDAILTVWYATTFDTMQVHTHTY